MDGRTDGRTNRQTERKKERRTDICTYVELFHPMALQPSPSTPSLRNPKLRQKSRILPSDGSLYLATFLKEPAKNHRLWSFEHTHTLSLVTLHAPAAGWAMCPRLQGQHGFIVGTIVPLLYVI